MAKRRAFTGFSDSTPEPTPHDVAMIGTQLARADGTRLGLDQKVNAALFEAMAGPAQLADTLSEKIGEAVDTPVGEAGTLAAGVVNKAQGAFLQSVVQPTETAIRLGWQPQGAPGKGAGGRNGRRTSRPPQTSQPAAPGGPPPAPPAGSTGEAPGSVPGASAANMAGNLPAPRGPLGPSAPPVAPSPAFLAPGPLAGTPAPPMGATLFSGGPIPGAAQGYTTQPQQPQPVDLCHYAVLCDCATGQVEVYCLDDPRVQAWVAGGQVVPIRYAHDPLTDPVAVAASGELQLGWMDPNLDLVSEWVSIACNARANNGEGWPPGGDFPHRPPPDSPYNGLPVGDWPFDASGNYIGPQ